MFQNSIQICIVQNLFWYIQSNSKEFYFLKHSLQINIRSLCGQWGVLWGNYCKQMAPHCRKLTELLSTFHRKNWRNQIETWKFLDVVNKTQLYEIWSSELFFWNFICFLQSFPTLVLYFIMVISINIDNVKYYLQF